MGTKEEVKAKANKMRIYAKSRVFVHGTRTDKFGRGVLYWTSRNHNHRLRGDLEDCNSYLLDLFEGCMTNASSEASSFLCVADLRGFQMKNRDMSFVNRMVAIAQNMLPERLGTVLVLFAPWFFWALWKIIKGWIDERTVRKVHYLGSNAKEVLSKFLEDDQIPISCGGTMPEIESEVDIWDTSLYDNEEEEEPYEEEPINEKDEKKLNEQLLKIEIEERSHLENELKSEEKKKKKKKKKSKSHKADEAVAEEPEVEVEEEAKVDEEVEAVARTTSEDAEDEAEQSAESSKKKKSKQKHHHHHHHKKRKEHEHT